MFKSKHITNIWLSKYHQNFSYHFPSIFGTTSLDQRPAFQHRTCPHSCRTRGEPVHGKPLVFPTRTKGHDQRGAPACDERSAKWGCQSNDRLGKVTFSIHSFDGWKNSWKIWRFCWVCQMVAFFFGSKKAQGFLDMQPLRKQWCSLVGMLVEIGIFYRTM